MRRVLALTLITLSAAGPLAGLLTTAPALAAGSKAATTTTAASPAVPAPSFSLGNAESNSVTTVTTSTPVVTTSSTSGGGLSKSDGILTGVITIAVLSAIAVYVLRDARSRTARDPDVSDDPFADKRKGSKAPPKSRKLTPAERKRRKRGRAPRGR